jgi:hypothetical protein
VEHVADVRSCIEGKFVIIVGDRKLAEELGVNVKTSSVPKSRENKKKELV